MLWVILCGFPYLNPSLKAENLQENATLEVVVHHKPIRKPLL